MRFLHVPSVASVVENADMNTEAMVWPGPGESWASLDLCGNMHGVVPAHGHEQWSVGAAGTGVSLDVPWSGSPL